jgi:hypothetical protein
VFQVPKKNFSPKKIRNFLFNTLRGTDILFLEKMLDPHHSRRDGGGLEIKSRLSFLLQEDAELWWSVVINWAHSSFIIAAEQATTAAAARKDHQLTQMRRPKSMSDADIGAAQFDSGRTRSLLPAVCKHWRQ